MLVIAVVLVMIAAGCAVLITEASRDMFPSVGPDAQLHTHAATQPAPAAAPVIPVQRTASDMSRVAATYGFIAELPAEKNPTVQVNL